jgi:hypothetical protein
MDTQVTHTEIRIVSHSDHVTKLVRRAIADVAHTRNLKVTIVETPFAEYVGAEKKTLVVIAYDISKANVSGKTEMGALIRALECADKEAPNVQLAISEDSVDVEDMDDWLINLAKYVPLLPFDPVKQPDVIIEALAEPTV